MTASTLPPLDAPYLESKDEVDAHLHDLANALAAARSFGEVLKARSEDGGAKDRELAGFLLQELDRASDLVKKIRKDARRPGDVLECGDCGYTFVNKKATARKPQCRRCDGENLRSWAPSE